jgi:DNA polymerase-3 subunit epsilon
MYYNKKVSAYRPDVDLSLHTILAELELPELPRHDPMNDAITAAMIFLKLNNRVSTSSNNLIKAR